ncbi:MoxR family ATPase [uncultured Roseobacter sp.]|uniref:ATP-binding protein n=1 Tax=uncultured Roseobacter sp. TaxID=114847 RepID=UPI002635FE63|nr:MoxR family ATPase [uncultured Roseobacter sp.]
MSVNTTPVTPGRALDLLRKGWQAQRDGALTSSWMLHGRPGVGKTDIVRQLANETGAQLFDLRLTTIEPQDLRGLPYYDHEAGKTVWYRPEDLPDDPEKPAILFLDELTAAPPMLQPTVYGLLQERRVGRHRLPDTVFVAAAGNMIGDGAVAYEMGTALSDRLIHLLLQPETGDWLENFAAPRGLEPAVTAFLRGRPDLLDTTSDSLQRGQMIACTPRAWERVSRIMAAVPDRADQQPLIAGTLGEAVAAEFAVVADDIAATVHIDALLSAADKDRPGHYPTTLHGLNAVVFGLVGAASEARMSPAIDAMEAIRHLDALRPGQGFTALPLSELCSFGFEMLMARALREDTADAFAGSDAYARYAADRQSAGLD